MFVWSLDIGLAYFQSFYNFPAVSFLREKKKNKSHISQCLMTYLEANSEVEVAFETTLNPSEVWTSLWRVL